MTTAAEKKRAVANAALEHVERGTIVGVGGAFQYRAGHRPGQVDHPEGRGHVVDLDPLRAETGQVRAQPAAVAHPQR